MQSPIKSPIISKVINLLSLIGDTKRPLTFTELVGQSGLNKSTTHRLLSVLIAEKMVQYNEARKTYLLGTKAFDIVKSAYFGYDIQALALDDMMDLHKKCSQNVSIGVIEGDSIVYLRSFDKNGVIGRHVYPGVRQPIHVCANGKAMAACMSPSVFETKFRGYDFFKRTDRSISSFEAFREDVSEVRARGYATNDREEFDYTCGIASPIFNYTGEAIASVNVWSYCEDASLADLENWADALMETTTRISKLIGGAEPETTTTS